MSDLVKPTRRVARFVYFLLFILVAQLTYLQFFNAESLENDPNNVRTLIAKFSRPRGDIVSADNEVVAYSTPSNDQLKFQRNYPKGELFGHITGYQSFLVGNTGVEASYNKDLTGKRGEEENVPRVVLSVRTDVQQLIKDQLGDRQGAVVVMEASTGSIVGMYANPSFDPTPLAGHDSAQVQQSFNELVNNPEKPSLSRAFAERYPPGSTYKILTSAASIEAGLATADRRFSSSAEFIPKQTNRPIRNFGGGACGGTLRQAFTQSCNTVFARLGTELADNFTTYMNAFGIGGTLVDDQNVGDKPTLDIPGAVGATAPLENSFSQDQPQFALAGIGQGRVSLSPLSVALMTSAIANKGFIPTPHVVNHVEDGNGTVKRRVGTSPWKENVISPSTANDVTQFMIDVVQKGTGTRARLPNVTVAGKTGTAQRGCAENDGSCSPHAWFTSFAPAENPQYVVTVFIDADGVSGSGDNSTGGRLAAPIAKAIYERLFATQ